MLQRVHLPPHDRRQPSQTPGAGAMSFLTLRPWRPQLILPRQVLPTFGNMPKRLDPSTNVVRVWLSQEGWTRPCT